MCVKVITGLCRCDDKSINVVLAVQIASVKHCQFWTLNLLSRARCG